jgi:hypothetical protein
MASDVRFRPPFTYDESSVRSKSLSSIKVAPEDTGQDAAREQPASDAQPGYSAVNSQVNDIQQIETKNDVFVKSIQSSETLENAKAELEQRGKKRLKTIAVRDLHWVSRRAMLGCFGVGVVAMICHHIYYSSRVRHVVGDVFEQQMTRAYVSFRLNSEFFHDGPVPAVAAERRYADSETFSRTSYKSALCYQSR